MSGNTYDAIVECIRSITSEKNITTQKKEEGEEAKSFYASHTTGSIVE
jgi:hypothetical protein